MNMLIVIDKMSAYTPKDVYDFARNGDSTSLTAALAISSNCSNWYTDDDGRNALHKATTDINCVSILLNNGIDVNSKDNVNKTALSLAATHGRLECMELLLANGADINNRNNYNYTALHYATICAHETCLSLLLDKGAVIDDDINLYKTYYSTRPNC